MSGYSWTFEGGVPMSPNSSSELRSFSTQTFGQDIWLSVFDGEHKVKLAHAGDYLLATEGECLAQALYRRAVTRPGDFKFLPGYGVGLQTFVNDRDTPVVRNEIARRVSTQFIQDPRVSRVLDVVVERITLRDEKVLRVLAPVKVKLAREARMRLLIDAS